jgi:hypothetical protein
MRKNFPFLSLVLLSGLLVGQPFVSSELFSLDEKEKEKGKEKDEKEKAKEKDEKEKAKEKDREKEPEKPKPKESAPPLARLLELNKEELFGGDATIAGDRVVIKFPGKGSFGRAFLAKGFVGDPSEIKGAKNKEAYLDKKPGELSCVGTDGGSAISKFELADDFNISFKLKIPTLLPQGMINFRVNQQERSFVQTSFFTDLTVVENGKPKKSKLTASQQFQGLPSKWFDRKDEAGLGVEIIFKDKKLSVFLTYKPTGGRKEKEKERKREEIVYQEGLEAPSSGKLAIIFSKVSFGLYDLSIDGKVNRDWAEKEIQRLKDEGKLRTKEEEILAKDDKGGAAGSKTQVKPSRVKKGPVNLDEPDPEAEVDL